MKRQKGAVMAVVSRTLRRIVEQRHTGSFARFILSCGHEVGADAIRGIRTEGFAQCETCSTGQAD
jgi:hypothetical protein